MPRLLMPTMTALLVSALASPPAGAATLTITCEERDAPKPSTMTVTYEGETDGTIKVVGSFGEMSFQAQRSEGEVEVDGQKVPQTSIYGFGKAHVMMPAKAALEACVMGKRTAADADDLANLVACHSTIETVETDIDAEVSVAIASYLHGPSVTIRRTYLEPTKGFRDIAGLTDGPMTVENTPRPDCASPQ